LTWLRPLFGNLKKIIDEYVEYENEPPYWNNEQTSRSLLVAAASRTGFVSLAEYPTTKSSGRKKSSGRCDLYLSRRYGRRYPWLEIETKAISVRCPRSNAADTAKEKAIAKQGKHIHHALWGKNREGSKWSPGAVTDARRLRPHTKARRAGLVFAQRTVKSPDGGRFTWKSVESDVKQFRRNGARHPQTVRDRRNLFLGFLCRSKAGMARPVD